MAYDFDFEDLGDFTVVIVGCTSVAVDDFGMRYGMAHLQLLRRFNYGRLSLIRHISLLNLMRPTLINELDLSLISEAGPAFPFEILAILNQL